MLVVIKYKAGLILLTRQWHHIDDTALVPVCLTCEFMQLYYSIVVCFYFCFVCILSMKLQQSVVSIMHYAVFSLCLLHSISLVWSLQRSCDWFKNLFINPAATAKHNRKARTHAHSSPYTRLSVQHRAQMSSLSVGKHWINVRGRLSSVADEFSREISLIRTIIVVRMKMMTLQRSGRAVRTQQMRSRDLHQLGGCLQSCDEAFVYVMTDATAR